MTLSYACSFAFFPPRFFTVYTIFHYVIFIHIYNNACGPYLSCTSESLCFFLKYYRCTLLEKFMRTDNVILLLHIYIAFCISVKMLFYKLYLITK
jgi:hypothetical protein